MKDNINLAMLNEFEKQIDEIMLVRSNQCNFNQLIEFIDYQKHCWQLCRVDLQNRGNEFNRINIFENSSNLEISFPAWFRDYSGQGCQVQGQVNKFNLKFQCLNDGILKICLRGVDYRNLENLRYPVYVNFTTFKLDDELIFEDNNLICHDQPFEFEIFSNDKDLFNLHLEFKTIYDYFPFLLNIFNDVHNQTELNEEYSKFKNQIKVIRFIEYFNEVNISSLDMYNFIQDEGELILGSDLENLSYNSFSNYYNDYLNVLNIKDKINQLNSRIEFLENKLHDCENIIESDNEYFNTIFLNYTLKPNKLLYNVQTLCLELLSFIGKICKKYGIKWWLDYGTLLGSIRHENFIPWDDDIDIGMMRKDYHKFIEVIYAEIENNNLMNYIDVGYRWRNFNGKDINSFLQFYMRDEKIGDHPLLAGVDVFPYDFMKHCDENTLGDSYNISKNNFYQRLCNGYNFSEVYMGLDYSEVIGKYYQELNLSYDETNYIIPGVEGAFGYNGTNLYELSVLEYHDIFPLSEYNFNEYIFPVPQNSHSWLNKIYGNNYMRVPKIMRTHDRLKFLRNITDIYKIFENRIVLLKEVNNNFEF